MTMSVFSSLFNLSFLANKPTVFTAGVGNIRAMAFFINTRSIAGGSIMIVLLFSLYDNC